MNKNIVSDHNTAIGYYAMRENTYGHSNTAIGRDALIGNKVDSFNVAVGAYALENALNLGRGSQNTAVGFEAMRAGGDNAVVIGAGSGKLRKQLGVVIGNFSHQNSSDNTVIGDSSMYLSINMLDNVAIGKSVMKP